MFRKYSGLAYLLLIALGVFGAWLNGWFMDSVDDLSFLRLISGFIILIGAMAGIVLLIRHNMRPMNQWEIVAWESVRKRGKRSYLRNAIVRGFLLGSISISYPVLSDYWKAKSFSLILDSLWIYVALFLVVVFGAYYAAIRTWNANEKDYETLVQAVPQHNNSFNPTPR
jgi:TRAP-type C4-dicarboxylate transport system permease small subunit